MSSLLTGLTGTRPRVRLEPSGTDYSNVPGLLSEVAFNKLLLFTLLNSSKDDSKHDKTPAILKVPPQGLYEGLLEALRLEKDVAIGAGIAYLQGLEFVAPYEELNSLDFTGWNDDLAIQNVQLKDHQGNRTTKERILVRAVTKGGNRVLCDNMALESVYRRILDTAATNKILPKRQMGSGFVRKFRQLLASKPLGEQKYMTHQLLPFHTKDVVMNLLYYKSETVQKLCVDPKFHTFLRSDNTSLESLGLAEVTYVPRPIPDRPSMYASPAKAGPPVDLSTLTEEQQEEYLRKQEKVEAIRVESAQKARQNNDDYKQIQGYRGENLNLALKQLEDQGKGLEEWFGRAGETEQLLLGSADRMEHNNQALARLQSQRNRRSPAMTPSSTGRGKAVSSSGKPPLGGSSGAVKMAVSRTAGSGAKRKESPSPASGSKAKRPTPPPPPKKNSPVKSDDSEVDGFDVDDIVKVSGILKRPTNGVVKRKLRKGVYEVVVKGSTCEVEEDNMKLV